MQVDLSQLGINKEAVVEALVDSLSEGIREEVSNLVKEKVTLVIEERAKADVAAQIEAMVDQMLDFDFEEVTSWGEVKGKYTLRSKITEEFKKQCEFKRDSYGPSNEFSKHFQRTLDDLFTKARPGILEQINTTFTQKCFDYALEETRKKLGIKV